MSTPRPSPPTAWRAAASLMAALLCIAIAPSPARWIGNSVAHPDSWPALFALLPTAHAFAPVARRCRGAVVPRNVETRLFSLKPAAIPLMDSGKALARSGELLIDLTSSLGLYGGSLSACGANVRNCGDCVAQAAASCRFKTAAELVTDELREGADCLREGGDKLSLAIKESEVDEDEVMMKRIGDMIGPTTEAARALEEAGASILRREELEVVGRRLVECGEAIGALSACVGALDPEKNEGKLSAQRMLYASQQMVLAGKELLGEKKEKPKGKSWIKG